ncbi:trimeric intracellular cation channel family protein [Marinobacterium arenosum]|uniref:trimeric intracellular cation channel family protein n=1 Tax=Marinobacterium arenosum TaxID=2862496 RepID=UPI001C95D72A|nr:trimeric intracellular cation channel family protein [Marinobacterium arenosum]MBY4675299.1 trimeric intracellular cation channel family protein [Marinobacterium arenosum]
MQYQEFIYLAELVGVVVFASSGALAAQGKRLDILGVVVLAIVTALGGGTLRDIVLDSHPVSWIANTSYLWMAIVAAVSVFILCRYWNYPRRALLVLDAMGLALFAILGAQKALAMELPPVIVVIMAMVTGCAGGMIRDIITGQIPLILQRDGELYATCALLGALFYVVFDGTIDDQLLALVAMAIIFLVRLAAMFGDLCLPEFVMAGHRLEPREVKKQETDKP